MKRVRIHAILALCAVALVAPAALAQDEADGPRPKAVVEEPVFDAETVDKGSDIVHDFVIKNEGDAPLEITDVRPTCGCTVADYDEVIAPGASGKVHAVLDTTTFDGGISKGISVLTNDPDNPHLLLTIKARVEPKVFVLPGYARFVQTQMSAPGQVSQLVFNRTFADLEVNGFESPYDFVTATYRPATEEEKNSKGVGNQWVVTLTLDYERAPVGALAEYVIVKTNHPAQSDVAVPVTGFVRPMVVVTPQDLDLGKIQVSEAGTKARLTLKNYAQENIQVSFKDATVPGVTVDVDPIEEGREFTLNVVLGPELPKGDFAGTIELQLDHPKKKSLEIALRGTRI